MVIVSDDQFPFRQFFFCLYNEQPTRFVRDTVIWNTGNPEADTCQINQKVIAAQLDFRHKIQLMLLEKYMKEFAGCTFLIQHKNRILQ